MSSAGIVGASTAQGAAMGAAYGGPWGAAIGGAVGAISGVFGAKASKAAKKAEAAARRLRSLQRYRMRVDAARSYRIQAAQAEALAANAGQQNDSAVVGALGAFRSQTSTAFGYENQENAAMKTIQKATGEAQRQAGIAGVIGQFAGAAGMAAGTFSSPAPAATTAPDTASGGYTPDNVTFNPSVSFATGTVGTTGGSSFSFSNPGSFL